MFSSKAAEGDGGMGMASCPLASTLCERRSIMGVQGMGHLVLMAFLVGGLLVRG